VESCRQGILLLASEVVADDVLAHVIRLTVVLGLDVLQFIEQVAHILLVLRLFLLGASLLRLQLSVVLDEVLHFDLHHFEVTIELGKSNAKLHDFVL